MLQVPSKRSKATFSESGRLVGAPPPPPPAGPCGDRGPLGDGAEAWAAAAMSTCGVTRGELGPEPPSLSGAAALVELLPPPALGGVLAWENGGGGRIIWEGGGKRPGC